MLINGFKEGDFMKKLYNKKIIISCTLFCLALTLGIVWYFALSPKVLEADYPYYPEVSNITEAADVIVVGKVLEAEDVKNLNINTDPQTRNSTDSIPYTISKVEVTDVIKGNVEIGDILEVKQLGDFEKMPEAFLAETDGYFNKDDSELLFLASFESTPYSPLNPTQGAVKVLEDQTLYSASKYSLFGYEAKTRSTPQTLDDAIAEISKYVQYQGAIGK